MGHKYSNFADSFADLTANYSNYIQTKEWAYNAIWSGYDEWADPATKPQVYQIVSGVNQLINALLYVVGTAAPTWQDAWLYESLYWLQQESGKVTWQDICVAWAYNDFEGRALTIGFIDRMRQLLWDEPYYIAFAARPEQGET